MNMARAAWQWITEPHWTRTVTVAASGIGISTAQIETAGRLLVLAMSIVALAMQISNHWAARKKRKLDEEAKR